MHNRRSGSAVRPEQSPSLQDERLPMAGKTDGCSLHCYGSQSCQLYVSTIPLRCLKFREVSLALTDCCRLWNYNPENEDEYGDAWYVCLSTQSPSNIADPAFPAGTEKTSLCIACQSRRMARKELAAAKTHFRYVKNTQAEGSIETH